MELEGNKRRFRQDFACFRTLSLAHQPLDRGEMGRSQQEDLGADWHYITGRLKGSLGQMRAKMTVLGNAMEVDDVLRSNEIRAVL